MIRQGKCQGKVRFKKIFQKQTFITCIQVMTLFDEGALKYY